MRSFQSLGQVLAFLERSWHLASPGCWFIGVSCSLWTWAKIGLWDLAVGFFRLGNGMFSWYIILCACPALASCQNGHPMYSILTVLPGGNIERVIDVLLMLHNQGPRAAGWTFFYLRLYRTGKAHRRQRKSHTLFCCPFFPPVPSTYHDCSQQGTIYLIPSHRPVCHA